MIGRLAERLRMTEGQLDTAVLAVLLVMLLSLTGLPTAERAPSTSTPHWRCTPVRRPG